MILLVLYKSFDGVFHKRVSIKRQSETGESNLVNRDLQIVSKKRLQYTTNEYRLVSLNFVS